MDPGLIPLMAVAGELRDMPRGHFKAQLKSALLKRAVAGERMDARPEGFHTVTPYLVVRRADEPLEFVKHAFDAVELLKTSGSAGGMHAEVRIGDSIVMLGGGSMVTSEISCDALPVRERCGRRV